MIEAGYSEKTSLNMSRPILGSLGVARATAAQEEARRARRDSASEIKRKAGAKVSTALDSETDPNYALSAWATASKVKAEYPDESSGELSEADLDDATSYVARIVARVLVSVGCVRDDTLLLIQQAITAEDEQAIPPATLLLPKETATD